MTYLYNIVSRWDTLSTKLDADTVVAGESRSEQDTESSVNILHNVDIEFGTLWATYSACDFTCASLGGIDRDDCLLVNWDGLL